MKNNTNNNSGGNHNRAALVWMMASVIASSFVVLIIWGETNKSPFFFEHFCIFWLELIILLWHPKIFFLKKNCFILPAQKFNSYFKLQDVSQHKYFYWLLYEDFLSPSRFSK